MPKLGRRQIMSSCLVLVGGACGAEPSTSPIRINEVMASNATQCPDELNENDDWVELYNDSPNPVNLRGYTLTDDESEPLKYTVSADLQLPSRTHVVFWADGTPDQGSTHLPFKLSSSGEELRVFDPDGLEVDRLTWDLATSDTTLARVPDGTGPFLTCLASTCGKTNGARCAE